MSINWRDVAGIVGRSLPFNGAPLASMIVMRNSRGITRPSKPKKRPAARPAAGARRSSAPLGLGLATGSPARTVALSASPPEIRTPYDQNVYAPAYAQAEQGLRELLSQEGGSTQQRMQSLSGMYNFGDDPRARAARDAALASLTRQRDSATGSINVAYQGGIDASRQAALDAITRGNQTGAELAGLYTSGADAITAANNDLAHQVAQGAGFLGVNGPVGGDAVDAGAALAVAAPREQALAQSLGQVDSNMQNWLGASMDMQRGAEQGQMNNSVLSMQSQVNRDYMQREADRIASEHAAYREAQMSMQEQSRQRSAQIESALADSIQNRALAGAEQQQNREQYLADLRTSSQERTYAEQQAAAQRRHKLQDQYRTDRATIATMLPAGSARRSALRTLNRSQPKVVKTVRVGKPKTKRK